jgi:hypothetical protein
VEYDYSDLDELVLAYADSVHKSQGSEYPSRGDSSSDPALYPTPKERLAHRNY